jgi:hypothetical protein
MSPNAGAQPIEAHRMPAAVTDHPVIVSITSLPSRLARIRPCLESLLGGSRVPDKILLALSPFSAREHAPYVLPDFLKDDDFCRQIVEVVSTDRDWGPGTKLLGVLDVIPQPCYLVLADDDVRYKPDFLRGLVDAQARDHSSSFSYFTHRVPGLSYGQGVDGFGIWSPNVSGIRSFAEAHVAGTNLFFHDDLWISFFLTAKKRVAIKSLAHLTDGGTIYESLHHINALHLLEGPLSRGRLDRDGVKRLLREVDMPASTRLRMQADALCVGFFRDAREIARLLPRLILRRLRRAVRGH